MMNDLLKLFDMHTYISVYRQLVEFSVFQTNTFLLNILDDNQYSEYRKIYVFQDSTLSFI